MLKIDLTTTEKAPFFNSVNFSKQALVCKVGSDSTCDIIIDKDENCPLPRGYFAYNLIDYLLGVDETCTIDVSERESEKQQFTNLTTENHLKMKSLIQVLISFGITIYHPTNENHIKSRNILNREH